MNIKKTVAAAFIAVLVLCLFACGAKPIEIPDENGEEDYSLAVLTLAEISAVEPKYSCRVYGIGIVDETKSNEKENSVYDADKIEAEASAEFSGVAVLQKTYGKEDKITFTVKSERKKGNMRIVLVDEKLSIIHDFTLGETSVYELEGAKGKKYEIRIACESAEFNVSAERTFG